MIKVTRVTALLLGLGLAACSSLPGGLVIPRKAATGDVVQVAPQPRQTDPDLFAIAFLDSIQAQSIADQREYCGFFYFDDSGAVRATPPRRGTFATCSMPAPRPGFGVFASYHTHGAYGEEYDNEVPSVTDLQSDFNLGLDGYVSTPGGRVWRVNRDTRDTVQLCGLRCVTADPDFVPRNESGVFSRYTLLQLALRNGS